MEYRPGEAATGPLDRVQGVDDQVGAYVVGDRNPASRREHRSIMVAGYSAALAKRQNLMEPRNAATEEVPDRMSGATRVKAR